MELATFSGPYQLFAIVHLRRPTENAIYVHTPNPNGTPFPCAFPDAACLTVLPGLLAVRIDLTRYAVLKQKHGKEACYIIQPLAQASL